MTVKNSRTVGIITLFDLNNVGNRLQNYAVHSYLTKLGYICKTLACEQYKPPLSVENRYKEIALRLRAEASAVQQESPMDCKRVRFRRFTKKYIPYEERPAGKLPRSYSEEYDYFVTGSDQVWNPYFTSVIGQLENHLLAFAPPNKRICFAPSLGVDDVPEIWKELYEKEWSKYRCLSSREQAGADLIKRITGQEALAVLDPTMMIEREEWERIARPLPDFDYEQGYILYYLLGDPKEELPEEMLNWIEEQKAAKGLRSVRVFDPEDPVLLSAGPEEFLHLIANASLICTDSFHGTVFSILFGRPFLLVERELRMRGRVIDMSSRIDTLLSKLGLEERLPSRQVLSEEAVWNIDFADVYEKLESERAMARRFLLKSFNREE